MKRKWIIFEEEEEEEEDGDGIIIYLQEMEQSKTVTIISNNDNEIIPHGRILTDHRTAMLGSVQLQWKVLGTRRN